MSQSLTLSKLDGELVDLLETVAAELRRHAQFLIAVRVGDSVAQETADDLNDLALDLEKEVDERNYA